MGCSHGAARQSREWEMEPAETASNLTTSLASMEKASAAIPPPDRELDRVRGMVDAYSA